MVEGRERLSETAMDALAYWYASFSLLLGLQLVMSILVVRFGGYPSYDEWTSGNGLVPSAVLLLLALGVPIILIWGICMLCRMFAAPCPWETTAQNLVMRRQVCAGLAGVIVSGAGIGLFMSSLHLAALYQRLCFVAAMVAFDLALLWWVRRASVPGRLYIRLRKVRQKKQH